MLKGKRSYVKKARNRQSALKIHRQQIVASMYLQAKSSLLLYDKGHLSIEIQQSDQASMQDTCVLWQISQLFVQLLVVYGTPED